MTGATQDNFARGIILLGIKMNHPITLDVRSGIRIILLEELLSIKMNHLVVSSDVRSRLG